MEKIYANSEEKWLKAVVLYAILATGGSGYSLFYDAEGTRPVHNSDYDWKDLFLKGLIRVYRFSGHGSNFYVPYRLLSDSEGVSLKLDDDTVADFFPDEENGSADEGGLLPNPGVTVPDDGK